MKSPPGLNTLDSNPVLHVIQPAPYLSDEAEFGSLFFSDGKSRICKGAHKAVNRVK
jgi:hypothetical protein